MTPFEKAGYTSETRFRVLVNWSLFKKGDILTLDKDDDTDNPWFTTEDGRSGFFYLPGNHRKELEVYKGD